MVEPVRHGRFPCRASPWAHVLGSIVLAASALIESGCVREATPCVLELIEGDVVVTEIRGPQDGPDSRGEWFELHNPGDDPIDLAGLRVVLSNLKGSLALDFLVRDPLPVPPGGYVVLGSLPRSETLRPELDYSFNADFRVPSTLELPNGDIVIPDGEDQDPRALFSDAKVELFACEERIDAVIYQRLPTTGTHSLDGSMIPEASINDDPRRWCPDLTKAPEGGSQLGSPGSPGEANRPCE